MYSGSSLMFGLNVTCGGGGVGQAVRVHPEERMQADRAGHVVAASRPQSRLRLPPHDLPLKHTCSAMQED